MLQLLLFGYQQCSETFFYSQLQTNFLKRVDNVGGADQLAQVQSSLTKQAAPGGVVSETRPGAMAEKNQKQSLYVMRHGKA